MSRLFRRALGVMGLVLLAARVLAAPAPVHGVGIEESLDGDPTASVAWPTGSPDVPIVVWLSVDVSTFRGASGDAQFVKLDARLSLYAARRIPIVLVIGAAPAADADPAPWRDVIGQIATRCRGRVFAYQVGRISPGALPTPAAYAFSLELAAVQIRSSDDQAVIVAGPIPAAEAAWVDRVYASGVAPYVDVLQLADPANHDDAVFRANVDAMTAVASRADPTGTIWIGPVGLSGVTTEAAEQMVDSELRSIGSEVTMVGFRGSVASLRAGLTGAARINDLLSGDLVALDPSVVRWPGPGGAADRSMTYRLVYSPSRSDTYLLYWQHGGTSAATAVEIGASTQAPAVRDPVAGTITKVTLATAASSDSARLTLHPIDRPLVLDLNYEPGATPVYSAAAEVRREVLPPVEEIVARAQEAAAAQEAALQNYSAHLRIEMHFHPTAADPAYNVVTENRLFADAAGKEWVEQSFSLNGATWSANRPSFPLLQPEKVLSLPLDLRLTHDYQYRLEGVGIIDGRQAFVVRFDPADSSKALYRGTVWIDRETFVRLKVAAVETRGHGVVSSNEEEQTFSKVGDAGTTPIWLPTSFTSRQTILVAGRTLLNEREERLTDVRLNAADFEGTRAEARSGDKLMYKDTDLGVRYFVKKGQTRVVSETMTTSAKAFAMGVDVDPSLDYPLPIGGLDILDFNFLHRDMQFALLFGGVIAFGNVQRAGLFGGRIDASVDFFGLAVKSNDSVFDASGERRGERVETSPASVGANVGYRLSSSQKLSGRYEIRYDRYVRDDLTSSSFVAPSSTATTGEGAGYEYRRQGYSATANISAYQRSTWQPWGTGESFDPSTRTYVRYDAGLSKDFVFRTFSTIHMNAQYFGGERLDRFSMYQFGLFDATRMHGVPSAVRFGDLAMLRGSYSFNVFDQYRLDLFVDQAVGRQATDDRTWRPVTGLGIGLNFRGPRSTIIRTDIGHSLLPDVYRGAGSTVLQVLILKPL